MCKTGMKGSDRVAKKDENTYYCVGCGKIHPKGNFYVSYSPNHANGRLFYCKDFIKDRSYYDNGEINKNRFMDILMQLDVPFLHDVFDSAILSNGDIIGHYFRMLNSLPQNRGLGWRDSTFDEYENDISDSEDELGTSKRDLQDFWGVGFKDEQYRYLENEFNNWTTRYKCEEYAEEVLYKEISLQMLEIRDDRAAGRDVTKKVDSLQKLMTSANVKPADTNALKTAENVNALGLWIEDIEKYRPAEYFDQKEKYEDYDGFKTYIDRFMTRPLKNLMLGTREVDKEFVIETGDDNEQL